MVLALGAQIGISVIAWTINQLHFWSARHPGSLAQNWTLRLLVFFILYHIPYAILIYALLRKPSRVALTYAIAVPAVLILQSLFGLSIIAYYFVHEPAGFVLLNSLPWLIHIVILVLAYRAIQQVGLHPIPSSILVAAIVTFLFFGAIHFLTPLLYRFSSR